MFGSLLITASYIGRQTNFRDHHTLQHDLRQQERWADDWGMRFNPSKCYILSINSKTSFNYQLSRFIVKHVQNNPYLGILLSNDLKWDSHITAITKMANSTLGFLCRNLRRWPPVCKQQAYISLVCPLLEYGAVVWDPTWRKILTAWKRHNASQHASLLATSSQTHRAVSPDSLRGRAVYHHCNSDASIFAWFSSLGCVEGLVPALPPQDFLQPQKQGRLIKPVIKSDFQTTNVTNRYARNNNRAYVVPHCGTEELKNFIWAAADWNQLDNNIVHSQNEVTFKTKLAANLHQ